MREIRFTPAERELLRHRLGCPDCLADALEEEWEPREVEQTARRLDELLARSDTVEIRTRIEIEVLVDAAEGTTFLGPEEMSPPELASWHRVCNRAPSRDSEGLTHAAMKSITCRQTVPRSWRQRRYRNTGRRAL